MAPLTISAGGGERRNGEKYHPFCKSILTFSGSGATAELEAVAVMDSSPRASCHHGRNCGWKNEEVLAMMWIRRTDPGPLR